MPDTKSTFGSVEQLAGVLRMNNPSRSLVESRTLAVIEILAEDPASETVRLGFIRNALAAAKIVHAELAEAER